ncbi:MAG: hypothetical protein FLDDKLPJ_03342 [Phycisphaerae bacterium]|nr:hypothetical protein [Phycisphaerae bacterium]
MATESDAAVISRRCGVDKRKPFPSGSSCATNSAMDSWIYLLALAFRSRELRRLLAVALFVTGIVLGVTLGSVR